MNSTRITTTTLWAALAFTWLAAAVPPKEPEEASRPAAAERDGAEGLKPIGR